MKFKYSLVVSVGIFILGVVLKFFSLPGAGLSIVVGFSSFLLCSLIYFIIALIKKIERVVSGLFLVFSYFIVGIGFKYMQWPGSGMIIVMMPQILFVTSMIGVVIHLSKKKKLLMPAIFTSISVFTFYMTFKLMSWPGASFLFYLVALPCIAFPLIIYIKEKPKLNLLIIGWIMALLTTIIIQFTPNHMRYYYFHFIGAGYVDAGEMDRYAWFLYQDGDFSSAKDQCEKALDQIDNDLENEFRTQLGPSDPEIIKSHLKLIQERNWKEYQWPDEIYR